VSLLTDRADPPGKTVAGRYELVRELGRGSFGHTFLARDRTVGRAVAIKVLDHRRAADWKAYELFEREAAVLRSLRHQGVPMVHDLFRDVWDGAPAAFLVMDYVEGVSLTQVIDEQRQLAPERVVQIFVDLLGILDYLHRRVPPVLHRDIKPSNIILRPDGAPVLVDFGSVRRIFLGPDETGSTVAGTYGYMPYEQYMGHASPASDLYALAATFLHLLTGRAPREFMNAEGRIEVPDRLPGDARLTPVIAKLLRPSPAARFSSARDARDAILSPVTALAHAPAVASLPPAPREIEGPTAELLDRVAPSAWALMDTSAKPGEEVDAGDVLLLIFFSVLTAGVLPIVFLGMARSRRRRLRRFFRNGTPTTAEIVNILEDRIPFDQRLARVSYQYEADGQLHRDVDQVLPAIADRWRPGDRVQILYVAGREYDSVIVG
jgi:serine/threonine protein kinase